VFLAYATGQGRALVDRELYLPRSWTGDPLRLAAAGVPVGTGFATKPELLQQMIKRAAAAGMPFGWVAADEAYGDNRPLRDYLEEEEIAYVLAVSRDHLLAMPVGRRRADELAARLPRRAWQRLSCGDGAKGERRYDWALVAAGRPGISLLIRRSISRPSQLAFYPATKNVHDKATASDNNSKITKCGCSTSPSVPTRVNVKAILVTWTLSQLRSPTKPSAPSLTLISGNALRNS